MGKKLWTLIIHISHFSLSLSINKEENMKEREIRREDR